MSYKLLVLDIDGTVTNSKKEITPKTKEAILELQKKGIPVAIASGRPTKGIVEQELLTGKQKNVFIRKNFRLGFQRNYMTMPCIMERAL